MTEDTRSTLDDADLRALAARANVRMFQKGSIVISEGEKTTSFYAIEDGASRSLLR